MPKNIIDNFKLQPHRSIKLNNNNTLNAKFHHMRSNTQS